MVNYMKNVMNRRKVKNVIIVVGIIGLIALILFIKMKYGTYGYYDFQHFFDQSKENIIETYGEPIEDEYINEYCEDMTYEDIKFGISLPGEKPESARITSPNIRFGILKIGVGSPKWEVMLAYGLKKPLKNDKKNQYSVQNGIYATTFYFDENDQVYKMTCGVGIYTF